MPCTASIISMYCQDICHAIQRLLVAVGFESWTYSSNELPNEWSDADGQFNLKIAHIEFSSWWPTTETGKRQDMTVIVLNIESRQICRSYIRRTPCIRIADSC